jgi:hypothetical protein
MARGHTTDAGNFITPSPNSVGFTHDNDGSVLVVACKAYDSTDVISGVSFNGVAMTLVDKRSATGTNIVYLFILMNPDAGAHTVQLTHSTPSGSINPFAVSYTSTALTGQPDASTTNTAIGALSITTSLTTVADNAWSVLLVSNNSGSVALTAGTGSTEIYAPTGEGVGLYDSNGGLTPAGSHSMTVNAASSVNLAAVMLSLAPTGGGGAAPTTAGILIAPPGFS